MHDATLNAFIALGRPVWRSVNKQVSKLLSTGDETIAGSAGLRTRCMARQDAARMLLPLDIPGYTDFYSLKEHATNAGMLFRNPKNALPPDWPEIPLGYNSRASSVVVSDTPVFRPNGQIKPPDQQRPIFGPCRKLDLELETGFIIDKPNRWASPFPVNALKNTSLAWCCSMTGVRATSRYGNTYHWGRSMRKPSPPRSRPGS